MNAANTNNASHNREEDEIFDIGSDDDGDEVVHVDVDDDEEPSMEEDNSEDYNNDNVPSEEDDDDVDVISEDDIMEDATNNFNHATAAATATANINANNANSNTNRNPNNPPANVNVNVNNAPSIEQQQRHDNNTLNDSDNIDMDDQPTLDGYSRTNRIGQGAYGIVYKGIQRSTGSTVAIKRIPFADATPEGGVPCNVIREISLLRELEHPNVVRLLDVNQAQQGELYLVFEFVAHDLKTYLDRHQTSNDVSKRHGLPVDTVRSFMKQIMDGVGHCHTFRILHRDLKPHNLLISSDGKQLKLADFGLARLSGLPSGPYTAEVVTLWYRAPELLLGATRYCGPVDVWSIGCIFAEMATGYALFPGRSDIDQLFKIFQRRGTPNNDIWPNCTRLPHYNPDFPQWNPRPIRGFIDEFDSIHAADLLERLLQYDPEQRVVCKAALQHPFFFET
mmetsp:Transcript_14324/g.16247  ORF Transcript_14324/g.16247 Transcript_14324/m.16247 type:complete len:450 (+) Transcript_14324:193-1542(+)